MSADSRRSHPLTFFLRFEIAEQLEPSRLSVAIEQCCRFHPLLAATIARRFGKWTWQLSGPLPSLTTHRPHGFLQSRHDWTFDLKREAGLRISVASGPSGATELWFQVHHSCSDARGILDYFCDLRAAYQQPLADTVVRQRELEAQRCLARRAVGFSNRITSYLNPTGPKWDRIWKYFIHRSRPLHPSLPPMDNRLGSQDFSPTFVSCRLPFRPEIWRQRRSELSVKATLNDRLLHALFHGLADHQRRISPIDSSDSWLRIGVPIDMREEQNSPPTACNCSSLVFLDQRLSRIQSRADLLNDVHHEMRLVKQHGLGCVFFDCLAVAHGMPFGMWLAVNDQRCAVSAVASNLGALNFSRIDGFTVQEIDFLPPLRPGTTVAVGMSSYNGELNLSLHYDCRLIATADARTLLEHLSAKLS